MILGLENKAVETEFVGGGVLGDEIKLLHLFEIVSRNKILFLFAHVLKLKVMQGGDVIEDDVGSYDTVPHIFLVYDIMAMIRVWRSVGHACVIIFVEGDDHVVCESEDVAFGE